VGKVVAGEVACFVVLTFMVVGVAGLQEDLAPEKDWRQVLASQWSTVVPHHPYWLPEGTIRITSWFRVWLKLTALVLSALLVAIGGSAVSCKDTRHQGEKSDSGETHYDYYFSLRMNESIGKKTNVVGKVILSCVMEWSPWTAELLVFLISEMKIDVLVFPLEQRTPRDQWLS
jgi:hypothetical protein